MLRQLHLLVPISFAMVSLPLAISGCGSESGSPDAGVVVSRMVNKTPLTSMTVDTGNNFCGPPNRAGEWGKPKWKGALPNRITEASEMLRLNEIFEKAADHEFEYMLVSNLSGGTESRYGAGTPGSRFYKAGDSDRGLYAVRLGTKKVPPRAIKFDLKDRKGQSLTLNDIESMAYDAKRGFAYLVEDGKGNANKKICALEITAAMRTDWSTELGLATGQVAPALLRDTVVASRPLELTCVKYQYVSDENQDYSPGIRGIAMSANSDHLYVFTSNLDWQSKYVGQTKVSKVELETFVPALLAGTLPESVTFTEVGSIPFPLVWLLARIAHPYTLIQTDGERPLDGFKREASREIALVDQHFGHIPRVRALLDLLGREETLTYSGLMTAYREFAELGPEGENFTAIEKNFSTMDKLGVLYDRDLDVVNASDTGFWRWLTMGYLGGVSISKKIGPKGLSNLYMVAGSSIINMTINLENLPKDFNDIVKSLGDASFASRVIVSKAATTAHFESIVAVDTESGPGFLVSGEAAPFGLGADGWDGLPLKYEMDPEGAEATTDATPVWEFTCDMTVPAEKSSLRTKLKSK